MKRIISIFIILSILLSTAAVFAASDTVDYVYANTPNPTVASTGGEWAIIGLAGSGFDNPEYYEKYYSNAKEYIKRRNGILHDKKYTEYSRVILALTAIGKNPRNVDGYDLIAPLEDYESTIWQGVNGAAWALIALDSGKYETPENPNIRDMYVQMLQAAQSPDGGWSLTGSGESDVDITGMVLTALSNYKDNASEAIERGLEYLSKAQNENGGFNSIDGESTESSAQALTALCALGIPVNDELFVKNGKTIEDNLLSFKNPDGSFRHSLDSNENAMATEQALYAMAALKRYREGKPALFDMSDVLPSEDINTETATLPVIYPGKTFSDIADYAAKDKIEALSQRGIVNGRSEDNFEPYGTMTRAEFTAIVTRSLGLDPINEKRFDDVAESDWFYGCVSAAYDAGITGGVSASEFNPYGTITREEAAVMTARAAKLFDLYIEYDETATRNVLAGFVDYISVSDWAKAALAYCCDNGILEDTELEIQPKIAITRGEIAEMLYNLLNKAKLI